MKSAIILCLSVAAFCQAQTVSTIANFPDADSGPHGVIQGADGNFYGWANGNLGVSGPVIYKVTPAGACTTLYTFATGGNGATSLIQASDGNFYGTGDPGTGVRTGSVFKPTPAGVFSPLHVFGGPEGSNPNSVIQASDGNLYGTAVSGGSGICQNSNGCGTIFKLTLSGVVTLLHTFNGTDGNAPQGPLLQGADGNLYGATGNGGAGSCDSYHVPGCGTIFNITPSGQFTSVHSFSFTDGQAPNGGLVQGADGNIYGTTSGGGSVSASGSFAEGTIFAMTPAGLLTSLFTFSSNGNPFGLLQAKDGNFYGLTMRGGPDSPCSNECGTLFQFTSAGTLSTLHTFGEASGDGSSPNSMLEGRDGNVYGTTFSGGNHFEDGTLF